MKTIDSICNLCHAVAVLCWLIMLIALLIVGDPFFACFVMSPLAVIYLTFLRFIGFSMSPVFILIFLFLTFHEYGFVRQTYNSEKIGNWAEATQNIKRTGTESAGNSAISYMYGLEQSWQDSAEYEYFKEQQIDAMFHFKQAGKEFADWFKHNDWRDLSNTPPAPTVLFMEKYIEQKTGTGIHPAKKQFWKRTGYRLWKAN